MIETLNSIDASQLNYTQTSVWLLNLIIGAIMFGVALEMRIGNFMQLIKKPKPILIGLLSQFLLLPAVTFLFIVSINKFITTSVALGMILVASCPGGNISNYFSALSKGNIELSVSLTTISTLFSFILTPVNFFFWSKLYLIHYNEIQLIKINFLEVFLNVLYIIIIPSVLGMLFAKHFPATTRKILYTVKILSLFSFFVFILTAVLKNTAYFNHIFIYVFIIVLFHNGLAFLTGYLFSILTKINSKDKRTITIETGIQNSGLGLSLIFNPKVFSSNQFTNGMAVIAGFWGIWHIISGLSISLLFNFRKINN